MLVGGGQMNCALTPEANTTGGLLLLLLLVALEAASPARAGVGKESAMGMRGVPAFTSLHSQSEPEEEDMRVGDWDGEWDGELDEEEEEEDGAGEGGGVKENRSS